MNKVDAIKKTSIPGLLVLERPTYPDDRGFFHEVLRLSELSETGIDFKPVQWSHAVNKPGVIRGIHTEEWQKVVYPITGKLFAAYVDTREDSRTFGKVVTKIYDNTVKNSPHQAIYIPAGVGNSVCAIGDEPVHYMYLVSEYWDDTKAKGIAWDDPDLAIDWPVRKPILSERDKTNPTLRQLYPRKFK